MSWSTSHRVASVVPPYRPGVPPPLVRDAVVADETDGAPVVGVANEESG